MSRRKKQIWIVVLVVLLLLAVWIAWGNTALMVSEYTVSDSRIPNGFSGYKIAHISDLHNASFGDDNEKLLQLIAQSQPDAVVITGDLVDSRRTDIAVGINFAAQAALLAPTYYVPGNHESRIAQYNQLLAGLEDANVVVMMNDKLRLEQTDEYISLIGVKDPSFADVSGREIYFG